ncbi:MAG: winged helix-turn-helix domain-containing protein [Pseudomonadota bacterium]
MKSASSEKSPNMESNPPKWTFLTNHSHVLILLAKSPDLTLREIAERIGITERAVHNIVSELGESGYLERARVGRRNTYILSLNKALRHPVESHKTVGDIVEIILTGMKL